MAKPQETDIICREDVSELSIGRPFRTIPGNALLIAEEIISVSNTIWRKDCFA